jgi:hypothetical protein
LDYLTELQHHSAELSTHHFRVDALELPRDAGKAHNAQRGINMMVRLHG